MHDDLDRLDRATSMTISGLSAMQTQATPLGHPEKWSIQQIVEHLLATYRATAPVIQARIEKGSPTKAVPSLRQRFGQFFLISFGHFPAGRSAPSAVLPPPSLTPRDGDDLAKSFHAELVHLDAIAAEVERLFGRQRAASHMILGPLSMQQWRRFHLIHGRHHLKQISAICHEHELVR